MARTLSLTLSCLIGLPGWIIAEQALLGARPATAADAERRPNLIFVLADDLGYGDLGAFGQQHIRTPELDGLSAEGMKLTSHYAGSTVCAPSRWTLINGRYDGRAETIGQDQEFQPGPSTSI